MILSTSHPCIIEHLYLDFISSFKLVFCSFPHIDLAHILLALYLSISLFFDFFFFGANMKGYNNQNSVIFVKE